MQRVTVSIDDELMVDLDRIIVSRGYQNRSEAVRDLVRSGIRQAVDDLGGRQGHCVASLTYVYDHEERELSKRLTRAFHQHHDLALASLHVHLDNATCMEVTVLKGPSAQVQHLAEHVIAERGVRYGRLVSMPVGPNDPGVETMHHRHE